MGRVKARASVQKGQTRAPPRPALGHQGSGPLALCCFSAQPSKGLPIAQDEVPDMPASWDSLIATSTPRGCHNPSPQAYSIRILQTFSDSPAGIPEKRNLDGRRPGKGSRSQDLQNTGSPDLTEGRVPHTSSAWASGPAGWPHSPHFSCFPGFCLDASCASL